MSDLGEALAFSMHFLNRKHRKGIQRIIIKLIVLKVEAEFILQANYM